MTRALVLLAALLTAPIAVASPTSTASMAQQSLSLQLPDLWQGQSAALVVDNIQPGARFAIFAVAGVPTNAGQAACPAPLAGVCLDLRGSPVLLGHGIADALGRGVLRLQLPATTGPVLLQAAARLGGRVRLSSVKQAEIRDGSTLDQDADGLSDLEEAQLGTDPALTDTDGDGLDDGEELAFDSSPLRADTDLDGLSDAAEQLFGTDPRRADTDNDGLLDSEEVYLVGTDPHNPDTDGDTLSDGDEYMLGSAPDQADADGDGLDDAEEARHQTDPWSADTDGDGISDLDEVAMGTAPAIDDRLADADGDGVSDLDEALFGTDPNSADTDQDGHTDYDELSGYAGSDPLVADPY